MMMFQWLWYLDIILCMDSLIFEQCVISKNTRDKKR